MRYPCRPLAGLVAAVVCGLFLIGAGLMPHAEAGSGEADFFASSQLREGSELSRPVIKALPPTARAWALSGEQPGADLAILDDHDLLQALREGGNVLYFRHAATDRVVEKWDAIDVDDCATQRNLSEEGRIQARAIGAAFAALGIQVAKVIASPFCRALETGHLAFGEVDVSDDLFFSVFATAEEYELRKLALRTMLGTPPPAGNNVILISHKHNLEDAVEMSLEEEGTAAIFRPRGDGTFSFLAMVPAQKWSALAGR